MAYIGQSDDGIQRYFHANGMEGVPALDQIVGVIVSDAVNAEQELPSIQITPMQWQDFPHKEKVIKQYGDQFAPRQIVYLVEASVREAVAGT